MTNEQKKYIENNIELIENNQWEEFFKDAPDSVGAVLYEAGIDFITPLRYVPHSAFYRSNLQTIAIPDGVTRIGDSSFRYCRSLESVTIGNSVTSIGDSAFWECNSLESVNIPDSVTSIGHAAFWRCENLTRITIPDSVTSIGGFAFSDCSKLEINYSGTIDDWEELIGNNDRVFKNTIYTCNCIDGVVKKSR